MKTKILTTLILAGLIAGPVAAEQTVPESRAQIQMSFAPVVKETSPAVVNVYARRLVSQRDQGPFSDPFFRKFFGGDGVFGAPRERVQNSLGSGVIVDGKGLIVTNNHVILGGSDIRVVLADRREFEAKLLVADERTDLAILKIEPDDEELPALPMGDSDNLEVGDLVLAIGNPFGVGQTVTSGIVSALARTQVGITDYQFFIQTDAAINPGNSGGALIDLKGNLIGINTAIFSRSGGSIGIGFAIPVNMVKTVVQSAETGGRIQRPWIGAETQDVTAEIAETLGLKLPTGALVANVAPNSPAARAGLKLSDLIVAIEGQVIDDPNAFDYRFATRPLGGAAQIDVQRGGKAIRVAVPLETAPDTGRNEIVLTTRSPFQGAKVSNISPAVADELRLNADAEGVVILEIGDDTTAGSVGFQKGDIILAVNNQKIGKTADLEKATREAARVWRITLVRGGQQINVTLGG